jgi:type IV pilus assembly protein PilN
MARINLLPWREKLRTQRKREFGAMLVGGILVAGMAVGYWYWFNEGRIDHQRMRNAYLQTEIKAVDQKIREINKLEKTRKQLIGRINVIQNLQASRPQVVHLFDEVVATVPDGVHLTELTQSGSNVTVAGRAQSNARVSAYMRNIEQSPWLAAPNLKIIENKDQAKRDGDEGSEFTLSAKQVVPKEETKP